MNCYRIKDWDDNFEVSQSRKAERPDRLSWVAVPNRHDGRGYRRLVRQPNGLALYGAWHLILQVASKCPVRGTLADKDGPLSAFDIADKCSVGVEIIEDALKVLCSSEIGWVEQCHWEPATTALPEQSTILSQQDKQDKTRQNKTEQHTAGADAFGRFWIVYPRKIAKPAAAKAWKQAVCRADPEAIIAAAKEFSATPKGQAGEYCPHPATWLNQERWNDDRAEWNRVRDAKPNGAPSAADRAKDDAARRRQREEQQARLDKLDAERAATLRKKLPPINEVLKPREPKP